VDQTTCYNFFINNCIGSFYRGTLDWFAEEIYSRISYKVLGTYDKSVEYFNKVLANGRETDKPLRPSLSLDPTYDFEPATIGGRFLWQAGDYLSGFSKRLFEKYEGFEDQHISLVPMFSRYSGQFELLFWLESVYELLDVRVMLFQYSGGLNRLMRPEMFETYLILPDEINDYTIPDGEAIKIDWAESDRFLKNIKNINQNKYVMPILLTPVYRFTAVTDTTEKYGADNVADYKLSVTVEYEVDIPTSIAITPFINGTINVNCGLDIAKSIYGTSPAYNETTEEYEKGGQEIPKEKMTGDSQTVTRFGWTNFKERAYYTFESGDELDDGYFSINNPFESTISETLMSVVSYTGILQYGSTWIFNEDKSKIKITVEPEENEIVEFFRYEEGTST